LIFAPPTGIAEHLDRHRHIDVFLDTFPYGAHTTAADAFWAGAPIVTVCGKSFASRVCASLLRTSGVPELVCESESQYIDLAVRLAENSDERVRLSQRLLNGRDTSPVFDARLFTTNLERAFLKMVSRRETGLRPDQIAL
jgi:predicted O-linked N-acetylglucosamine transferase (SPINDLY family)